MSTSYKTQGYGPRECHAGQNCICINITLLNDRSWGNLVLRNTKINTFTHSHAYPMTPPQLYFKHVGFLGAHSFNTPTL